MAIDLNAIPPDRIHRLAYEIGIHGRQGLDTPRLRVKVLAWLEDKQLSMTPWGVSAFDPDRQQWLCPGSATEAPPELFLATKGPPYKGDFVICGRWIRDFEGPCRMYPGATMFAMMSPPRKSAIQVLTAFQHGEVTDPSLDLAVRVERVESVVPETKRCLITELPAEIFEMILSYLIPLGGHTYHFLPARSGARKVQLIQKFVPELWDADPTLVSNAYEQPMRTEQSRRSIATGSVCGMSLAATCRSFQDIIYARFYRNNAFIFHLTAYAVENVTQSRNFSRIRAWSRTTARWPGVLGPLTARAVSYMKDITLIASLPVSHGARDVRALASVVREAADYLSSSKLDRLCIVLNHGVAVHDRNRQLGGVYVCCLQAELDDAGGLSVRVRAPRVKSGEESSEAGTALLPLLRGPKAAKNLELAGPIHGGLVDKLRSAISSSRDSEEPITGRGSSNKERTAE